VSSLLTLNELPSLLSTEIAVRYLYGPKEKCIAAFLAREAADGHPKDRAFWCMNNKENFGKITDSSLTPYRVEVFDSSGNHLSEELMAGLLNIETTDRERE